MEKTRESVSGKITDFFMKLIIFYLAIYKALEWLEVM